MKESEKVARAARRLEHILEIAPSLLLQIPAAEITRQPAPGKWSGLEIIGHLIDSATNNHQRFVRIQFENHPDIYYDQDQWNSHSRYRNMPVQEVIGFWAAYNRHLLRLIRLIPDEMLMRQGFSGGSEPATLAWLITDYVSHMEHHLRQVITLPEMQA